jgi:serine/threonine protein phosphatase PrpC
MDSIVTIIAIVGLLAVIAVLVYLLIRRRERPVPSPAPEPAPPEAKPQPSAVMGTAPLPPAQAPQFFELTTTDKKLVRLAFSKTFTTLGRAADNDIVVNELFPGHETVADHHARVELRGDLVIIEDLHSPDGLFVNDRRTGKNLLRNGWRIGLGDVELVFRTAGLGTAPLHLPETSIGDEPARQRPEAKPFSALPEGALIGDRYAVIELRNEMPHLNVYIVENLNAVRRCLQCGYEENSIERNACLNCGAALNEALPYYPHYQVKETDDPTRLSVESQLTGLAHPAALLPRGTLDETPFGAAPRHYLVGPDAPRWLAATARVPQKVTDVMAWSEQLAEGLAYLHQNDVTMGVIDAWRVALDGPQARWVDFSLCEFVTEDDRAARFAADVMGLAAVMYYLLTGQRDYTPQQMETLPSPVVALFDYALNLHKFTNAQMFAEAIQATSVEVRRPSSMDLRVGRWSDVGRSRQLNEDSLLTLELARIRRSISEPLGLYVVADGMGGHAAGDVASALVVDTLARKAVSELWMDYLVDSGSAPDVSAWLKLAVQEANQAVFGRRRASTNDMGTTMVAAIVCCAKGTATIAHVGDSRAYVINKDEIRQVTSDHSLVQRLVQLGQLTPQEARTHPQRNVIYKNLGDKPRIEPDITEISLGPEDRLLLCSDGLSGMITDDVIQQIVISASSPQEACRQLVIAANEAGGEDNISVIVVHLEALG